MLMRNPEVRRIVVIAIALTAASALACALALPALGAPDMATRAAVAILALLGTLLITSGLALTRRRYRRLAEMAENLDAALSGERALDFEKMGEGELAILASELDKVIARLNLTVNELASEKRALADSLADISHQLKTPLTSIALTLELVRTRLAQRDDAADLVERLRLVEHLQGRVEQLVAALLKLARIDAGVVKLVQTRVDAAALVEAAIEPLAIAFDIAGVTCKHDIAPGAGFEGDPAWSAEALTNVLKNCLEHTPHGGQVRIEVTEDVLACRIRVTDTGPGIAEADLPHIFERFYRGQAATGQSEVNPTGVGIGLSLAKSLVTAQGGTMSASNRINPHGDIIGAQFDLVFFKTIV